MGVFSEQLENPSFKCLTDQQNKISYWQVI